MSNFFLNNETVRRYLVRALAGDSERPRPPVSLAGQPSDNAPQPTPPPAPAPPIRSWPTHDRRNRAKSSRAVPEPGDEQGAYSREQLIRMDTRFRARLLRA